jgi:predicted nucleotidyltransferase
MIKGNEFSQEIKQLMFNVIRFVESEKNGPVIPLNNVNERLESILDISVSSVERLKKEIREEKSRLEEEKKKIDEEKENKVNQELDATCQLRNPRSASSLAASSPTSTVKPTMPVATLKKKFADRTY